MSHFNPLAPEFKFPANPLMAEIKWQRPGKKQYRCVLGYIVLSYSQNGLSKDFLMYVRDPGRFLTVLVIRRCVNAMEAAMETARSVEEDEREVSICVGYKAEG